MNSFIMDVVSSEKSVYFFARARNRSTLAVSCSKLSSADSAPVTDWRSAVCSYSYPARRVSKRSSPMRPTA